MAASGIPKRNLVIAAGAAIVLVVLWLAWASYDKAAQRRAVTALVADATADLREALAKPPAAGSAERMEERLQAARAPRDPDLAGAAEQYLVTAREIVRRRVAAERLSKQAAASRHALDSHMAAAASRGTGWIHQATELKKADERVRFDLNLALKALDDLLRTMPEAETGLPPAIVIDAPAIQEARQRAQEDLKRYGAR